MDFIIIPAVAVAFGAYSYAKAKKNKMSQTIGFTLMPGLWFGALAWCLLTGEFQLVFLVLAMIGMCAVSVCLLAKK